MNTMLPRIIVMLRLVWVSTGQAQDLVHAQLWSADWIGTADAAQTNT